MLCVTPLRGSKVESSLTFLGIFSPTKSPFYAIVLVCMGSMLAVQGLEFEYVGPLFGIYVIVLSTFCIMSFLHKVRHDERYLNYQLIYSRTIGVSASIISATLLHTMALAPDEVEEGISVVYFGSPEYFELLGMTSFFLLFFCFVFTLARAREKKKTHSLNIVQSVLIISILLMTVTYFRSKESPTDTTTAFAELTGFFLVAYFLVFAFIFLFKLNQY